MSTALIPEQKATWNGSSAKGEATMKALVYGGPGKIEFKDVPKPTIERSTGARITLVKATICGIDLGILHGKTTSVKLGTTLGHEGAGVIEDITITMGLVNTNTTPMLLKTVVSGKIAPEKLITHHFKLSEILHAYEVFGNAAKEKALKIIISN